MQLGVFFIIHYLKFTTKFEIYLAHLLTPGVEPDSPVTNVLVLRFHFHLALLRSLCRRPCCRSPVPQIVTICSPNCPGPVNCAHCTRQLRAVRTGSCCAQHRASLPPPQSARSRKRSNCHDARPKDKGGGGSGTGPT